MRAGRLRLGLLVLALVLGARDAAAAPRSPEAEFRRTRAPALLCDLADELLRAGTDLPRRVAAADLYRRCRDAARLPPLRREEIERFLSTERTPTTEIHVIGTPGALLRLDGRLMGALPLGSPLRIDAGRHTLEAERGSRRVTSDLQVVRGRRLLVDVDVPVGRMSFYSMQDAGLRVRGEGVPASLQRQMGQRLIEVAGDHRLHVEPEVALPGATYRVELSASLGPGGRYEFVLGLRDRRVRSPLAEERRGCDRCQPARALEVLAQLAGQVLPAGMARAVEQLRVTSKPGGAALKLNGAAAGLTPWEGLVPVGEQQVRLSLPGHHPVVKEVLVKAGEPVLLHVELPPLIDRRRRYRLVAFALGGAGVLGLGLGGALLGLDGLQACPENPNCPQELDSWRGGTAALVVGGAALVTSAVWLVYEVRRARAARYKSEE